MTKYIKYHKNYTEFGEPYQLVLPLNLECLVPDDDSVEDQRFFNISDTFAFSTHSTTWDASSVSLNTQEMIFLEYRSITLVKPSEIVHPLTFK